MILVIDDEKNVRRSISVTLEDAGYTVSVAEDAIRGMERIRNEAFDLVILDIRLGEISGIQLFQKLRSEKIEIPVLFMSGNASLSEAVETIRLGGTDFLEKPFPPDRLLIAVTRALRMGELQRELSQLKIENSTPRGGLRNGLGNSESMPLGRPRNPYDMIGKSQTMRNLWNVIDKVAPTRSKVLIQGESGTGKELIARAIYQLSAVSKGPFVKVNCAAIPSELIESELFGHERGSFTGATQMKRGFFELAHTGTIFLDEIAEMSPSAQAKVLRVLQNQEFTRVGGSQIIRVDVRVIAATHKDLTVDVREGRFREDLFFRLNVVPIRSAPLRERVEDIPLLFTNYLNEFCEENGFGPKEVTPEALMSLMQYSWPGNVRELRNLAERLVIFSGSKIDVRDLPEEIQTQKSESVGTLDKSHFGIDIASLFNSMVNSKADSATNSRTHASDFNLSPVLSPALSMDQFKKKMERLYLIAALKKTQGHISQAANLLDLERTYLHRKIQEHGIKKGEYFL